MSVGDLCRAAAGRLLRVTRRERASGGGGAAPPWLDRRVLGCSLLALLAVAAGLALVAGRDGERRSGTNGVLAQARAILMPGATACQGGEAIPAGTTALQIRGYAPLPPIVSVSRGGRALTDGEATTDPRRRRIRVPVTRASGTLEDVEVCIQPRSRVVLLRGATPPHREEVVFGEQAAGSSLAIDYLLPGRRSWSALTPTLAARIGRGRGTWDAGWTAWPIALLMATSLLLTVGIVLRTLAWSRPLRTGTAIAAVAAVNAVAWSLITPAFQVPDEVTHVAYVQSIGETGRPPAHPRAMRISPEEAVAMADAEYGAVNALTYGVSAWSPLQQRRLIADLRAPRSRRATISIGEVEPQPPLYYTLQAIPYRLASRATLLDRIALMRLLSAALAGVTALLCFLFVRECLPGRPWAWTVGGLGVALAPMLGFVSGGVNPDALMFAIAAGVFLCVARAWRRGVTPRLALAVGVLLAAGLLTKVNFLGLVPGALLGFALAARGSVLTGNRRALPLVGVSVVWAVVLVGAGVAFDAVVWDRPPLVGRPAAPESHVGLWSHIGYIWQVFLPRLPFQPHTSLTEPGYVQLFKTFVGAFGPLVVLFQPWVYLAAAGGLVAVVLLAVRMLLADPRTLRRRRGELVGYAAMAGGQLLLVGLSADLRRNLIAIVQGRYLLPLLPLLALLLALAARGAGERWGRTVGAAAVWSVLVLSVFGQLMAIAFFYS